MIWQVAALVPLLLAANTGSADACIRFWRKKKVGGSPAACLKSR